MAKNIRKRKRESTVDFPDREYLAIVLATGHDFFCELPADDADRLELLKAAWNDNAIKAAVHRFCRIRPMFIPPWAERQFGNK
jgi:hypothetical protein